MSPARQTKPTPPGITCPRCGAEIITQRTSREAAAYRLRHHDDGRHTMERVR